MNWNQSSLEVVLRDGDSKYKTSYITTRKPMHNSRPCRNPKMTIPLDTKISKVKTVLSILYNLRVLRDTDPVDAAIFLKVP